MRLDILVLILKNTYFLAVLLKIFIFNRFYTNVINFINKNIPKKVVCIVL